MRLHENHDGCKSCACPEYNTLSRRKFLAVSGSAAAIIAGAPAWLPRVAYARDHRGSMRDVIVNIFLRGGADGLSMFAPYGEAAYYANRPTLALPQPDSGLPNSAIDLGDGLFGLNPVMAPLMPAYNNGHLLAVHATGSTDPTRSHFDAMEFMEVGVPADPTIGTGWLGRHLLSVTPMDPQSPLRAVGISTGLQRSMNGAPLALPVPSPELFGLTGFTSSRSARATAVNDMYNHAGGAVDVIADNTLATIDLLNAIDFDGYTPAGGAAYPTSRLGRSLEATAALIKAQVGVEVVSIDIDAWDTHGNQGSVEPDGFMCQLMSSLAQSVGAFYTDMTAATAPGFIVVVQSEFGRRILENGSRGTDHGHGNAMILIGQAVNGGRVHTHWPGLDPGDLFEGLDLEVTIDYRSILAEIIQRRLGNSNLGFVFPNFTPTFENIVKS